jgi:hypothetical protein
VILRAERGVRAVLRSGTVGALVVVAIGTGCGKKGPPLPPISRAPSAPTTPRPRQIGQTFVVTFEVPPPRGSGPGQELVSTELVRVAFPPGLSPPSDPDVFRRRGQLVARHAPGGVLRPASRVEIVDPTSDALPGSGIGSVLRYAVRVVDRRGRRSPLVVAPDLTPSPSLPPPTALAAEPAAEGVRVSWSAPAGAGDDVTYNVYRTPAGDPPAEVPLNADPVSGSSFLDTGAVPGTSYDYSVRIALHPDPPYREGETAHLAGVLVEDRFAPDPPAGLVAVQEGLAVRLFWDPSPEGDLAGYRVYRRVGDEEWTPVGPALVTEPLFLDPAVAVDWPLSYRVTALDRAAPPNESAPSEPVEIRIVAEPVAGEAPAP